MTVCLRALSHGHRRDFLLEIVDRGSVEKFVAERERDGDEDGDEADPGTDTERVDALQGPGMSCPSVPCHAPSRGSWSLGACAEGRENHNVFHARTKHASLSASRALGRMHLERRAMGCMLTWYHH